MATNNELKEAIENIYEVQEEADGSRLGMQDALDQIRQFCVETLPELDEDADGDGIPDDEQED